MKKTSSSSGFLIFSLALDTQTKPTHTFINTQKKHTHQLHTPQTVPSEKPETSGSKKLKQTPDFTSRNSTWSLRPDQLINSFNLIISEPEEVMNI